MESTPDKNAVKIIDMTTKDLEYYINLVDRGEVGFKRTDCKFERSSTVYKILSNSITCHRAIVSKKITT